MADVDMSVKGIRSNRSIETFKDLHFFKHADLEAYNLVKWRWHYRLKTPGLYYQRVLRDVEYLHARGWNSLGNVRHAYLKVVGMILGISIPPGVFGPGLSIPHFGSIVVNDKASFGAFCRVHSATNIGEHKGGAPRGGDGVYIGPGAVLYGAITLGSNVVVGANSVVNRDVGSNLVVAGVPASVVGQNGSEDVMPQWICAALRDYQDQTKGGMGVRTITNGQGV